MHPPFHVVDHRIDYGPHPFDAHRVIRRNRPQSLRFDPPSRRYPVETFDLPPHVTLAAPGPAFRLRLARWLYRIVAGQPFPPAAEPAKA